MDPCRIPFNALNLIVGPTNCGKTQRLVDQLRGPFRARFDYIVLVCPTFANNKTYDGFVERDHRIFVIDCLQHEVEGWLKLASYFFESKNIILDDCAASKDVKCRTGSLVPSVSALTTAMKTIFEDYAGELTPEEYKELIAWLKGRKFSHLVFSLRHPYGNLEKEK